MRKVAILVLALAVTAGAAVGAWKTGFFQKAVWVFQASPVAAPGGEGGMRAGPANAARPVPPNGGSGERRGPGRPGGHIEGGAGRPGGEGAPGSGVHLANVGYFAMIMAFFAMGTVFLGFLVKRRRASRR